MTSAGDLVIAATLTKRFGVREVLSEARISVRPGTVHALVGENGAGKSTLVKIIAGVVRADAGDLTVRGRAVDVPTWERRAARAAGIGIVQQHGASAGTLTVVENAMLGVEPTRGPLLAFDKPATALAAQGRAVGLAIDPQARAEDLPLGAAQRAEIVAALYHGATLLVLDEPTAVLAPVEVEGLLGALKDLAAKGATIIIVTHKLDEVKSVADDVTVLRDGKTVATFRASEAPLDVGAIARAMVGEEMPTMTPPRPVPSTAPEVLAVAIAPVSAGRTKRAPSPGRAWGASDADVARDSAHGQDMLVVVRGELVGVAGVDGNGQRELARAIAGLDRQRIVRIGGVDATKWSTAKRLTAGLAYVPEDRLHGGLVLDGTVAENLALGRTDVTGTWRIDRAAVRRHAVQRIAELDIRPADSDAIVRGLSGGNQQKVVIGRELSRPNLRAVVAAQPTRGVDLGAVARIHERLRAAAGAGAGVLVISADLDELLVLCHRVVVMLRGELVGELGGDELRAPEARARLGALMTGAAS